MDVFYVIKVINKDSSRGYIMETPKGIELTYEGELLGIRQFLTYQDAQQFIRDNKIERHGAKAYIRDNNDLMKDNIKGVSSPKQDIWAIIDSDGKYLFFDTKKEEYYFDKREVGQCCWYSEKQCLDFIKAYELTGKAFPKNFSQSNRDKKLVN